MKRLMLGIALSVALVGCKDQEQPPTKAAREKLAPVDVAAGKAFAERECKGCHGLDGKGAAPGIPHLAAQRERYLLKGYHPNDRIYYGTGRIVPSAEVAAAAADILARPDVAYVHVRSALNNCYQCRIERS